jgi:ribosomal-protein-alanine acetyltransferase
VSLQFRRATAADVEGIMAIERATFVSDAWSTSTMAAEVGSAHTHYLVVVDDDRPDAVLAYAGLSAPQGAHEADIQTIAVDEALRGRGLGRALMRELIAEARARGAVEVFLEVRADNPGAQGLYRSLGFQHIATRPRYYQPDGVDALVMRLAVPEAVSADGATDAEPEEESK